MAGHETDLASHMRRLLSLASSSLTLICLTAVSLTLAGVILSYALPKKYEASSTVFIEQNVINDLVKGIAITPSIEAKLRILKVSMLSRAMLLAVAGDLDMDLDARDPAREEAMLQSMRTNADVRQDEKRGLFFITYTDANPVLARDFVNTITRRYIEESTASKRKESFEATSFLENQIKIFQGRIENAQQAIDRFKTEKGMYLGLNEHLLREEIREQEQRLENIRIQKTEQIAKIRLFSSQARLNEELEQKEQALRGLLAMYTEKHPAVRRAREDISSLRREMENGQQPAGITENSGRQADPDKQKQPQTNAAAKEEFPAAPSSENGRNQGATALAGGQNRAGKEGGSSLDYQKAQVELRSLEEMETNLRASIERNMAYLRELPVIRTELAALEQTKENEVVIYQQLVSRFGQSEVSKQMELQDKAVNFKVIDPAVLPTFPVSPNRPLIILGGMVVGILLGVGLAMGNDLLRGRIRSAKDLAPYDLEVLATLPRLIPSESDKGRARRSLLVAATLCLMLAAGGVALLEFLQLPYVEHALARLGLISRITA